MKVTVAVLNKQGDSAVTTVLDLLNTFDVRSGFYISGLLHLKRAFLRKALGIVNRQGLEPRPFLGCISSRAIVSSGYDFLQLDDAALAVRGKNLQACSKNSTHRASSKEPQHCEAILQTLIEQADGDYAFLMLKEGWIAAGRDPIGVQPLYYGENRDIAAFATNRKALWQLGIENPIFFSAGNIGVC